MQAYLDNSATTPASATVVSLMQKVLLEDYGNPSSMHTKGMEGENYMKEARARIAKTIKASDKEIYFTSGGTEANNLAIIGSAMANKRAGMHLITTAIEHPSVANPFAYLAEQGFTVTYLGVDEYGVILLDELEAAMTSETILVSIMHVNNELGAVQPIAEAAAIIRKCNPACLFHVDAIQSYGKYRIYPKKLGIDLMSVSGHKFHGPKGSGFLYVKEKTKIRPIILGGGQEQSLRSGTENVPAIAGLGLAAEEIYANLDENMQRLYELRGALIQAASQIEGLQLNGHLDETNAPHIVSLSIHGVRAEVLLHALEERGVYVSAGSACSSNKPAISKTLQAIGLDKSLLDSTVRLSLSVHTTAEEVDYACEVLAEVVPVLRRFVRR